MESYKEEHERFVSGHNGTTVTEVSLMTLAPSACVLIRDILVLMFSLHSLPLWSKLCLDYALIIIPAIFMSTLLSNVTTTVFLILCIVATVFYLVCLQLNTAAATNKRHSIMQLELGLQRPFIANMRSFVNISTALVILAVDFPVYPRHFAKTETYGTGFMDIGVGCFVVSNGLVCPEARGKLGPCQSAQDFVGRVVRTVKSSLPLLVFGVGRLLAVKGTDYHEHVTEYGVHWNFFFTLAVVKIVCTVLFCAFPVQWSTVLAVVIMTVYQYALLCMGLSDYILFGPGRTNSRLGILSANREGLFSCVGYVALYLAGAHMGSFLLSNRKRQFSVWLRTFGIVTLISGICYFSLQISSAIVQPVSRRMANLSFVLWMVGLSSQVLASCLLTDLMSTALLFLVVVKRKKFEDFPKTEETILSALSQKDSEPCLMSAVNYNGLFFFLLSNMMTGLVNFTVPTLYTSDTVAVGILHVYMFVLCAIIMYMFKRKVATRFW